MWIAILCALGFAARKGRRWACLLGIALYSPDMVALMVTFSIWAFGVHGFFVFRWFQGQKALQDLKQLATLPRFDEYGAECHNIRVFCECMGFSSPVP
jgi:hypothetical protein